ncbi:unnamed protein product [Lactuca saligna]|uniref:Uncharacterized protein n=1 Tax=Lactuca saligna TaxID=75948 RepID=A0AA35VV80_LACSI|nr:unnamed protein product [Lactuca saligna]
MNTTRVRSRPKPTRPVLLPGRIWDFFSLTRAVSFAGQNGTRPICSGDDGLAEGKKKHVRGWQHTTMASSTALLASSTTLATTIAVVYDHHSSNTHPMVEHRALHDGRRQEEKNKKIQRDGGGGTDMLNIRR